MHDRTRIKIAYRVGAIIMAGYMGFMTMWYGIESRIRGGSFWHADVTWTPLTVLALSLGAFGLGWLVSRRDKK
jgi:hypothetical protein